MGMKRKIRMIRMMVALMMVASLLGCSRGGNTDKELSKEEAIITLGNKIEAMPTTVSTSNLIKDLGDGKEGTKELYDYLPDIETEHPPVVKGNADIVIEIASSTEKASSGTNGSLVKIAENFNKQRYTVNGRTVAVQITSIASGEAIDYIVSGKYVWDAYTPSNQYWGKILESSGMDVELVTDRLAGNTAGFVFENNTYDSFTQKYGEVNAGNVAQAVIDGELSFGYTNPNASSTGLNYVVSMLYSFDSSNPLSSKASNAFIEFSRNINHLSYTTLQLTNKVANGSVNAFVYEYQNFVNTATLSKGNYKFVPFGVRHDSPLYVIGNLTEDKTEAINLFAQYCLEAESQKIFTEYGFNELDEYSGENLNIDGRTILSAQSLWKEEKNTSEIAAIFVVDTSGSMEGQPIRNMKSTLLELISDIDSDHYIGLVSYDSNVHIDLPVGKFDSLQQAYFRGAANSLSAGGNTATNDALLIALNMLVEFQKSNPDVKPMIILMSDGEQTSGYNLKTVSNIIKGIGIPINTVSYNANVTDLETLAAINEGAQISASTDNVLYKLKAFLSAAF